MDPKKTELTDAKNKKDVARGEGWGVGKMGEGGQKKQTSSYKILYINARDVIYDMVTVTSEC